ncbi:Rieske (2Fe-2S) protein [Rapidithrix thailandica]|uniref:Rieske (2Fe-2S) protein n=1 Tax=Rapidithrix thailandica TaxID=413964 RepID=A0AAW9S4C3_9BACT
MKWYKLFVSEEEAFREMPDQSLQLVIAGEKKICLVRNGKNLYAIQNICPHMGASLSEGSVNKLNEVVCPWHHYRFQLTDGQECHLRTKEAETYPIKVETNGIFIGIEA